VQDQRPVRQVVRGQIRERGTSHSRGGEVRLLGRVENAGVDQRRPVLGRRP
jgi:hypothetical protein